MTVKDLYKRGAFVSSALAAQILRQEAWLYFAIDALRYAYTLGASCSSSASRVICLSTTQPSPTASDDAPF